MEVTYLDHMGTDMTVVNAARVSFDKVSEPDTWYLLNDASPEHPASQDDDRVMPSLSEGDEKLIKYLATHNHWTPFGHPQISLHVKAPIFVRTQCFKHKVGFVENEISRRYVSNEPEFYFPESWREKPSGNVKQGSGSTHELSNNIMQDYFQDMEQRLADYNSLIQSGVCPEQARMILPQSMYTEWHWTGSLAAFARFAKLRTDPHAQHEIQVLAHKVCEIIEPLFPVSWDYMVNQ